MAAKFRLCEQKKDVFQYRRSDNSSFPVFELLHTALSPSFTTLPPRSELYLQVKDDVSGGDKGACGCVRGGDRDETQL